MLDTVIAVLCGYRNVLNNIQYLTNFKNPKKSRILEILSLEFAFHGRLYLEQIVGHMHALTRTEEKWMSTRLTLDSHGDLGESWSTR